MADVDSAKHETADEWAVLHEERGSMREETREEVDRLRGELSAARAAEHEARLDLRVMASALFKRDLQLARREGYIDRVREVEAAAPVTRPVAPINVVDTDDIRRMLTEGSQQETTSLLDVIGPDLLAKVLGCREGGDER